MGVAAVDTCVALADVDMDFCFPVQHFQYWYFCMFQVLDRAQARPSSSRIGTSRMRLRYSIPWTFGVTLLTTCSKAILQIPGNIRQIQETMRIKIVYLQIQIRPLHRQSSRIRAIDRKLNASIIGQTLKIRSTLIICHIFQFPSYIQNGIISCPNLIGV